MTLIDTSAWIEFIHGSRVDVRERVRHLTAASSVAVTEPVRMELLAGALDEGHARRLANMLAWAHSAPVEGLADWESAAAIYRACRRGGFSPRSQIDCLIAAVAIREDLPVLHADRDFDEVAKHTSLRIAPV